MKRLMLLSILVLSTHFLFAQKGNSKKENNSKKESREVVLGNQKDKGSNDNSPIWEGTKGKESGQGKTSKNQPAKVREAFGKDYPNANNVSWSKYRGDWTATFNNGVITSTAVYHANGQRKDTRTIVQRSQLPKVIIDDIFKKRPSSQLGDIVKIELPETIKNIFRIKTIEGGASHFTFYDADGKQVTYDY